MSIGRPTSVMTLSGARVPLGRHRLGRIAKGVARLRTIPSQLVAPVAGSSGALWRLGDGFSRRAISPCGLNENAPV
jgi:hypothetical protein